MIPGKDIASVVYTVHHFCAQRTHWVSYLRRVNEETFVEPAAKAFSFLAIDDLSDRGSEGRKQKFEVEKV